MKYYLFFIVASMLVTGCSGLPFAEKEDHITDCRGICLSARTNKGVNTPNFKNNDALSLHVKVNKVAYISVLYRDAEGQWFLLVQNHPITLKEQLNTWLELPQTFKFEYKPYGKEDIWFLASPERTQNCTVEVFSGFKAIPYPEGCFANLRRSEKTSEVTIPIRTSGGKD